MKKEKRVASKRLLQNVRDNKSSIFFWCIIYTLAASVYPVIGSVMPKFLIGELMSPSPSIENVIMISGIFLVVSVVLIFIKNIVNGAQTGNIMKLRIDYMRDQSVKLMTMDYEHTEDATFFEKYDRAFTAISNNTNGIEGVYNALWQLPALVITGIALTVIMGMGSIVILVAVVINMLVGIFATRKVQELQYRHKEERAHAARRLKYYTNTAQDFSYGKDIRLYNLKGRLLDNFRLEMKKYIDVIKLIAGHTFRWDILLFAVLLLSDAATYFMLVWHVTHGMSIADFSMYLSVVVMLSTTLKDIADKLNLINEETMYVVDFFEFMDAPLGTKGGDVMAVPQDIPLKVEFKNVSFKYPNTDKWIFKNLNLVIPAGQRLAVVGINGAGKTTLVKLIMGLFKADEGEILINDVKVEDYDKKELAKMFAVVFQDVNIFALSVKENVAGTSENIDEARVDTVLEKVGLKEKIAELPKGKEQPMLKVIEEDGVELSGGQSQKLAIARALYKGGNMVIMDEPTSALDALAEAEIYEDFSSLVQGKTAIYISHRLASTKFCDKIAFFDGDGLSEYGSHDELMELKGKYYDMFTVQGKYYQVEEA